MDLSNKLILSLSFLLLFGCGGDDTTLDLDNNMPIPVAEEKLTATYELTLTSNWSMANFPTNYPDNAHFSPLVGLTHSADANIFANGEVSSPGVIVMAETGSKDLLKEEIAEIQNLGYSANLIDELGIGVNDKTITITFEASQDFPLLSVVSMVAPSPDWFIGIDRLLLFKNNQWIDDETVQLVVYDAGSDNGELFKSDNMKTTLSEVITLLSTNREHTDFNEGIHYDSLQAISFIKLKRIE